VNWLGTLPGRLLSLIGTIASGILEGIGILIGTALAIILKGPEVLWDALMDFTKKLIAWGKALPGEIADALKDFGSFLWNTVIIHGSERVLNGIINFGKSLKSNIANAFSSAVDYVKNHILEIVNFVQGLPHRIAGYGKDLYNAGRGLVTQLFNGISHLGDKIGGFADAIVDHIKGALNSVIVEVNKGINKVGHYFPGGLPNIPQLANGAIVSSPTLALNR